MLVNPVFHDKSKHIEMLQYILTDDQTADVHNKPLPRIKLEYFRRRLGVEENVSLLDRER